MEPSSKAAACWDYLLARDRSALTDGKIAQDNPAKLMAEIEATIKRLGLKQMAKDVHEVLKRLGAI